MFVILSKILVFIFLLINTVTDIKHKKIWFPLSILVLVLGIIMHLLVPGMHPVQSLAGMIPGLLLLGIYLISRHAIGAGDGISVCACGSMLGLPVTIRVMLLSMFLAAAVALLLVVRGKANRRTRLPYMPFLLASYIVVLLL